ncbi:MAG: aminopeptidase N [Rhodoferax sp.]
MLLARDASAPTVVRRQDYTPPAFWIDTVTLTFDLDPAKTRVLNVMRLRRNTAVPAQPLRLDGEDLNLARVLLNGQSARFRMDGKQLVLDGLPEDESSFELEIFTTCAPAKNTQLMGLYVSHDSFFTQCEAEGFRRITYFLDRPDVMASYTVTLRADKTKFPVLLSNGNLTAQGDLPDGRHFATWVDPFKKPCYLFALVAGQLVAREQRITARNGREHLLQVYVRPGDMDKTEHAMASLIKAIIWDEARFGLALDLERFMIVATSDFNMGAMENKGLNIFNTKYVLASPATATDVDYANIESVVGHEYFHNWTGNRVTCRDWFQLSLKEGLTVFRDQEFSMDLCPDASSRAVKRIEDVRVLRTVQFAEDAGPMAHPVRPDQYQEINNFYTVTVYEKGAEVVRMMQTLCASAADPSGRSGFAAGMRLYFERHDGCAVTCDDFAQAMADANPDSALARNLAAFKRWYAQAGTPHVQADWTYDAAQQSATLTLTQSCPQTPGQAEKQPFVIPVRLGLVGAESGRVLPVCMDQAPAQDEVLLVLTEPVTRVTLRGLDERPVPSLLRGFSAPIQLQTPWTEANLRTLLAHDPDPFNRWEAGQQLMLQSAIISIAASAGSESAERQNVLNNSTLDALRGVLRHPELDAAFKELVLTPPSEGYIAEQLEHVDPQRVHVVREALRLQLAQALFDDWQWAFEAHRHNPGDRPDAVSSGRRALASLALSMLCLASHHSGDTVWPGKAYQRFKDASNMTDRLGALTALVYSGAALATPALERFHALFRHEELVLDKWFALQASCPDRGGQVLPAVRQLLKHPDFSIRNPNRARSLIFSYCNANPGAFHRTDAAGYVFWADQVLALDAINPQVAARLARALDRWKKLAEPYRSAACEALNRVAAKADLSNDVREVVGRALAE